LNLPYLLFNIHFIFELIFIAQENKENEDKIKLNFCFKDFKLLTI
jgi:hypothetical protein